MDYVLFRTCCLNDPALHELKGDGLAAWWRGNISQSRPYQLTAEAFQHVHRHFVTWLHVADCIT